MYLLGGLNMKFSLQLLSLLLIAGLCSPVYAERVFHRIKTLNTARDYASLPNNVAISEITTWTFQDSDEITRVRIYVKENGDANVTSGVWLTLNSGDIVIAAERLSENEGSIDNLAYFIPDKAGLTINTVTPITRVDIVGRLETSFSVSETLVTLDAYGID